MNTSADGPNKDLIAAQQSGFGDQKAHYQTQDSSRQDGSSHRSNGQEEKKRRGVALGNGLTGLHIKQTGPPVKFRRNQYNQLNVTTNIIPAVSTNGIFASSEPQNLSSSMNANGKSSVGASATNVFTSNGQGVIGKGGNTNRLSTISPRIPMVPQGTTSGAFDISPTNGLTVVPPTL